MSAEEERLRRAVARGAGEGEIRKLLGIVAAKSEGSKKADVFSSAKIYTSGGSEPCFTTSRTWTHLSSCSVEIPEGDRRDDPAGSPIFFEGNALLDSAGHDPAIAASVSVLVRHELGCVRVAEGLFAKGVTNLPFSGSCLRPFSFHVEWKVHVGGAAVCGRRSLSVRCYRPPPRGDVVHLARLDLRPGAHRTTACGWTLTDSTPFSTEPVLVTCVACRSAAP